MLRGPELRGREGNGEAADSCQSAGVRQRQKSQAQGMGCYGNQGTQAKVREFCSVSEGEPDLETPLGDTGAAVSGEGTVSVLSATQKTGCIPFSQLVDGAEVSPGLQRFAL